jgi:hypothetical protein
MKASFCALVAVFACLPASAQQFWNGTKYGMSVQEVRTLLGPAIKEDSDPPGPPIFRLEMDYVLCAGKFGVLFLFRDDKLYHESFVLVPASAAIAGCVVEEYAKAYGRPTINEQGRKGIGDNAHVVFTRDDTVVDISIELFSGITESGGSIVIFYDIKDSKL